MRALGSLCLLALAAAGCGSGTTGSPCIDAAVSRPAVDCGGARCPAIAIAGDAPAGSPGTFRGYADPAIAHDPAAPQRVWLAYSWPHLVPGRAPNGSGVLMAAVSTHLARSDDGGGSFSYVGELWPAIPSADPEGGGANGISSSDAVREGRHPLPDRRVPRLRRHHARLRAVHDPGFRDHAGRPALDVEVAPRRCPRRSRSRARARRRHDSTARRVTRRRRPADRDRDAGACRRRRRGRHRR